MIAMVLMVTALLLSLDLCVGGLRELLINLHRIADFRGTTFQMRVDFRGATFQSSSKFDLANFQDLLLTPGEPGGLKTGDIGETHRSLINYASVLFHPGFGRKLGLGVKVPVIEKLNHFRGPAGQRRVNSDYGRTSGVQAFTPGPEVVTPSTPECTGRPSDGR